MDQFPEVGVKFEDLKKEERYKKLERNLKLAFVKQMEQAKAYIDKGYCTSPTWPSLSSINVDGLDTTGCPSLQVSRVESEVVASSSNLHKILAMKRNNCPPMATSSVKKLPISDSDRDRAIMPPPPPVKLMYRNANAMSEVNTRQNVQNQHVKNNDLDNQADKTLNVSRTSNYQDYSDSGLSKPSIQDLREPRIFQRWRVLLNNQGNLIIKGFLADCGKIARSKPILQRLSSNKVQSVYKHIYILDGNICDERNELPDYVRGKFHNGFPDDWENVYQLWRNFVTKGSNVTFRWPTPITDSDDDIVTEITDFSYCKNKEVIIKESIDNSNVIPNNATSSGYHSKSQSDSLHNLERSNEENTADKNEKLDDLKHNFEVKEANNSRDHENSNNTKDSSVLSVNFPNVKCSRYLHEILQEDKLSVIRSNLGNKNCPPQYLDKFIELIDCLRYLLSYTPNNETEAKNQSQGCLKCSSTFSESQEINPQEQPSNIILKPGECHKEANYGELVDPSKNLKSHENYNNLRTVQYDTDNMTDSSDSDVYMGIPNVRLNCILKPKIRSERYRDVKNRKNKKNIQTNMQAENENKFLQNRRLQLQNDSSISVTEDECESRQLNKMNDQKINQIPSLKSTLMSKTLVTQNKKHNEANKGAVSTTDIENIGTSEVNSRSTPKKRVIERSKPIIKSNEPVHIDLKSKNPSKKALPLLSDISFLDEEVSIKKQKLSYTNDNDVNDDKITDDLLQHPFLTYDSEDFPEIEDTQIQKLSLPSNKKNAEVVEKSQSETRKVLQESPRNQNKVNKEEREQKLMSSSKKRKMLTNDKTIKSEPFGSKENPKLLTSWIPCVMYEDELQKRCNLIFEGKLLNETGHVLTRKFTTDFILKRHSPTLIETVKNEYFMLVGEVNDTKHALPKELLKQFRSGCPAKIKEICEEWKQLKPVLAKPSKIKNLHNASIDHLSLPTSSRGRTIVPPLNYWEGERMVTKEFGSVYEAGNILDSSLNVTTFNKSLTLNEKPQNKKETNVMDDRSSVKILKVENKSSNSNPAKQSNKRVAQQAKNLENESDDKKPSTNKKPIFSQMRTIRNEEILPESVYTTKLRKRQRTDIKQSVSQNSEMKLRQRKSNVVWSYEKKQNPFDVLSDDQSSVIIK